MTDDWSQIFDRVKQVPGGSSGTKKLTEAEAQERWSWINQRNASDIAISFGGVDTGEDFDPWAWMSDWSSGVATSITEHTEAIATLEEIAALNSSPAYLADIQDMVTVPRRDCAVYGEELSAYTDILAGIQCPISTHYHYLNTSVIRPGVVIGASQGTIYYTPVIVDRIGSLQGIRWMTGPDYLFSIDYYEMALCALDIGSGDIVKLWGSGNIKDGLPSSSGGLIEAYIEFDFDPEQVTTPGQILFVAHQQTAPGGLQQPRRIAAAMAPNAGRPDQILDAATYLADAYTQGIPSSIAFDDLTRENRFIPWGAVRVDTSTTLEDGS